MMTLDLGVTATVVLVKFVLLQPSSPAVAVTVTVKPLRGHPDPGRSQVMLTSLPDGTSSTHV